MGSQGLSTLAPPLRRLAALKTLRFWDNEIGDEGVVSLVANLGETELKQLHSLDLDGNRITAAGSGTLMAALDGGALPKLEELDIEGNLLSEAAEEAICAAFERNDERRHKLAVAETNIESRFKIESMSRAVTSRAVSRAWMRARSAVIPAEFCGMDQASL